MPKPYPQEFRDDVVRVARAREAGVTLAQIAKDFGVHEMTLNKWMRQADIDDGNRPGATREITGRYLDLVHPDAPSSGPCFASPAPHARHG